jgi:hypothetical protein
LKRIQLSAVRHSGVSNRYAGSMPRVTPVLPRIADCLRESTAGHTLALSELSGTGFAMSMPGGSIMSLVRLLGFRTLNCGCVIGKYRELATSRELTYVEEKGVTCQSHAHRRNHTIHAERLASPTYLTAKAS